MTPKALVTVPKDDQFPISDLAPRDLVSTLVETNLTIQGKRLNIFAKQVTSRRPSSPCRRP